MIQCSSAVFIAVFIGGTSRFVRIAVFVIDRIPSVIVMRVVDVITAEIILNEGLKAHSALRRQSTLYQLHNDKGKNGNQLKRGTKYLETARRQTEKWPVVHMSMVVPTIYSTFKTAVSFTLSVSAASECGKNETDVNTKNFSIVFPLGSRLSPYSE